MTHKLTEEQQRAAHKIIVANRGDCKKESNYLNCFDCPWYFNKCSSDLQSPEFKAKNLRRSQAWLDEHITDAEIMAESPREFCERMVRPEGYGKCKAGIKGDASFCMNCATSIDGKSCTPKECFDRAKAFLDSHATPQEPPKRRPTPEEMFVGATVRVRLWDELVKDNLTICGKENIFFVDAMKKYCGNTYKIIRRLNDPFRVHLENCCNPCSSYGHWKFIPEMLDFVEPEKTIEPVNFYDWLGKKVVFKDVRNRGASYTVFGVYKDLDFDGVFHFKSVFFFKLLELKGPSFPANLFNLCETQTEPEPTAKAPTDEKKSESIVNGKIDNLPLELSFINFRDLESQVKDLTKKLAASERKCERLIKGIQWRTLI